MAHHQHRPPVGGKVLLQPGQGGEIQVVGRFVQHQQIGPFQQQLRQSQASLFPAGHSGDDGVPVVSGKAHAGEHRVDLHLNLVPVQRFKLSGSLLVFLGHGLSCQFHPPQGSRQLQGFGKRLFHLLLNGAVPVQAGVLPQIPCHRILSVGHRAFIGKRRVGNEV